MIYSQRNHYTLQRITLPSCQFKSIPWLRQGSVPVLGGVFPCLFREAG